MLVPANDMAMRAGNVKAANVAVLGAFVGASGVVSFDTIKEILREKLGRKKGVLDANLKVLEEGYQLALESLGQKDKK